MADGTGGRAAPSFGQQPERPQATDLHAVTTDWITIWHSELAAMATDRELQETWVRLIGLWAQTASAAARFLPSLPPPVHEQDGRTRPASQTRPEAPVATPDARDTAIQHLASRVEDLERQLRALAAGPSGLVDTKLSP